MRVVSMIFLIFRIGATLWIAAIGVYAGLQFLGYLAPAPKFEPIAWTISLVIIGLESIGSIIRDRLEHNRAKLRVDLDRAALTFVLEQLKDGHGANGLIFEELGVSVWVPTRWSRVRGRVFGTPREKYRLQRLNRFRPDNYPQQSGLSWTGAMGSLGKCWVSMKEDYHDNYALAKRYGTSDLNEKAFSGLRESTKRGFTRDQFTRIVGKYSEIRAIPIMHSDGQNGSMIGVLTIDRVYAPDQTPFLAHLSGESTLRRGVAAASLVASTLSGKR